jgi:radical SAM protein with 4Fe4S-binding SPASM domain
MANRFPIVYPNGDLYSCCCTAGFYKEYKVGNLEQESLAELQGRMEEDPVFEAIYRVGPVALAKSVRECGVDLGEGFASPCHACRRTLAKTDRETLERESRKLVLIDELFTDPEERRRFEELV